MSRPNPIIGTATEICDQFSNSPASLNSRFVRVMHEDFYVSIKPRYDDSAVFFLTPQADGFKLSVAAAKNDESTQLAARKLHNEGYFDRSILLEDGYLLTEIYEWNVLKRVLFAFGGGF